MVRSQRVSTSFEMGGMVLVESRSVLLISTTADVFAALWPVYVALTRCQHAQMFLSLFHSLTAIQCAAFSWAGAWATPGATRYIVSLVHRSAGYIGNH